MSMKKSDLDKQLAMKIDGRMKGRRHPRQVRARHRCRQRPARATTPRRRGGPRTVRLQAARRSGHGAARAGAPGTKAASTAPVAELLQQALAAPAAKAKATKGDEGDKAGKGDASATP